MYAERLPPHDLDAEEAVIGSLLLDGEAVAKVAAFLEPDDFYRERDRWCYEACMQVFSRNEAINQISVADELARRQRLEEVGGQEFLSHVIATVPTPVYVEHYARLVHRLAVMRSLIEAGGRIATLGYDAEHEADEAIRQAEDHLYRLRFRGASRGLVPLRSALDQYLEEEDAGLGLLADRAPVPSGFADLDKLLGGLHPSDLIVLAARPSMGKSSLALNIARAVARTGKTVAIFSLEMSVDQVVERFLASESGVPTNRIRSPTWSDVDERAIMDAAGGLAELPVYVDDSPLLNMVEMRSKVRRLQMEQGLDFVVVDYLQLMQGGGRNGFGANRVQEISEITRSIKGMARSLNAPILAVSQLSRAVEGRPDRVPQLSDLRESGSIEQDADVVLFIYRPDLQFTEEEWERRFPDQEYPRGLAEILVAKHRNGPVGRVQFAFREQITTFVDLYRGAERQ